MNEKFTFSRLNLLFGEYTKEISFEPLTNSETDDNFQLRVEMLLQLNILNSPLKAYYDILSLAVLFEYVPVTLHQNIVETILILKDDIDKSVLRAEKFCLLQTLLRLHLNREEIDFWAEENILLFEDLLVLDRGLRSNKGLLDFIAKAASYTIGPLRPSVSGNFVKSASNSDQAWINFLDNVEFKHLSHIMEITEFVNALTDLYIKINNRLLGSAVIAYYKSFLLQLNFIEDFLRAYLNLFESGLISKSFGKITEFNDPKSFNQAQFEFTQYLTGQLAYFFSNLNTLINGKLWKDCEDFITDTASEVFVGDDGFAIDPGYINMANLRFLLGQRIR